MRRFDIEPQQRSGQRADRREDAETTADVRRDLEDRIVFLARDREKIALFRIRRHHKSFAGFAFADRIDHPLANDGERRHGFGGYTGFCDDVDDGVLRGDRCPANRE